MASMRDGRAWLSGGIAAALLVWSQIASALPALPEFEAVRQEAQRLAGEAYRQPDEAAIPQPLRRMGYDQYQAIRSLPGSGIWSDRPGYFQAELFPAGFIFDRPVAINVLTEGTPSPIVAQRDAFDWSRAGLKEPPPQELPLAGMRILYPLHGPTKLDEIAVFLGASYFRMLGRDQVYGISARGLAIDTGLPRQEEFPVFRSFWLVSPPSDAHEVTILALLDSPGIAGAYQFVLRPGAVTTAEVTAILYPRHHISLLGIAPMTSMFLAGENSDRREADFRPEVHDSDGLLIEAGNGERIWRPLANPAALTVSSFQSRSPRGFGLMQRDRSFESYQDQQAQYHRRPSLWAEPIGDWGEGEVRLIEIPSTAEIHDNIVAFWVSREPARRGQAIEVSYRLHWLGEGPALSPRGRATATRMSGINLPGTGTAARGARRIVVDFAGGELATLEPRQPVLGEVSASSGRILASRAEAVPARKSWRLVIDVEPEGRKPMDLRAYLRLYDRALTETWTYLWRP